MPRYIQRSFSSGEVAPSLGARADTNKHATGLKQCRNALVRRNGSLAKRSGTKFVCEVKTSADATRILPFIFSDEQAYVLEFGDEYARIILNGARLATSGVSAWAALTAYTVGALVTSGGTTYWSRSAHTSSIAGATGNEPGVGNDWASYWYAQSGTIYELPTVYDKTELFELGYAQSADVMTLTHREHPVQEFARYGVQDWRIEEAIFRPSIDGPVGITATAGTDGGGSNGSGTDLRYRVTAIKDDDFEESIPGFAGAGLSCIVYAGGYPSAGTWSAVPTYGIGTVYTYNSVKYVSIQAANNNRQPDTQTAWWQPISSSGADIVVYIPSTHALSTGDTVTFNLTAGSPGVVALLDGNQFIITVNNTSFFKLDSTDGSALGVFGSGLVGVPYVELLDVNTPEGDKWNHVIEWTAVTGAREYWIYRAQGKDGEDTNGVYGYVGNATGTTFTDTAGEPDFTATPPEWRKPFNEADSYPACAAYFQQRLAYGCTDSEPTGLWLSRVGSFSNFCDRSPLQDDDSITVTVAGAQPALIRALVPMEQLIVFTSEAEWIMQGDASGVVKPDSPNLRPQTYNGSSTVRPLVVNNAPVYVQARGRVVRDTTYDTDGRLTGRDLTTFAPHMFDGYTIVDMAYQSQPDSVIWMVRSDGALLSLTYIPEQEIWAWARHNTNAGTDLYKSVCVVPEDGDDIVYLVVERIIGGSTKKYIERMEPLEVNRATFDIDQDSFYVDCGLRFTGPLTNVSGMGHLEGRTVTVLADGVVYSRTISGGVLSSSIPSSTYVVVGLPYTATIETMDVDSPENDRSDALTARTKQIKDCMLLVENSRGLSAGPSVANQTAWNDTRSDTTAAYTGKAKIKLINAPQVSGGVIVRHTDPLPLSLLGLVYSFELGQE